jgi:hypothetical protein
MQSGQSEMLGVGEWSATTPCPWQVLQGDSFLSASMNLSMEGISFAFYPCDA